MLPIPVYFDGIKYKTAHRYVLNQLKLGTTYSHGDQPITVHCDELFFVLDTAPGLTVQAKEVLQSYRHKGVRLIFMLYDILPVLHPEWWPSGNYAPFVKWVQTVCELADNIICISAAVADSLFTWLNKNPVLRKKALKISYSHIGADIKDGFSSKGLPKDADLILKQIQTGMAFLTVGTLEPRKGHAQALSAFELLWKEGLDVKLVIVGKQGWMVEKLTKRIQNHSELHRRLFWLQGISDEFLEKIYSHCHCLLAASEGEGFGLPLIEGAAYGLPLIVRDIPVFREVAGMNAHYFEGLDSRDLAVAVKSWMNLYETGQAPSSSGMKYLNWVDCTQNILNIIQKDTSYTTWFPNMSISKRLVDSAEGVQSKRSDIDTNIDNMPEENPSKFSCSNIDLDRCSQMLIGFSQRHIINSTCVYIICPNNDAEVFYYKKLGKKITFLSCNRKNKCIDSKYNEKLKFTNSIELNHFKIENNFDGTSKCFVKINIDGECVQLGKIFDFIKILKPFTSYFVFQIFKWPINAGRIKIVQNFFNEFYEIFSSAYVLTINGNIDLKHTENLKNIIAEHATKVDFENKIFIAQGEKYDL